MRYLNIRVAALATLVSVASCKSLDVPNYTRASLDLLQNNPTATVINNMAVGFFRSIRGDQQIETLEIYARNAYNLDPSEVRSVTIPLIGPLDPAQGPSSWPGHYQSMYAATQTIAALDKLPASGPTSLTDQQKNGVKGFFETWMAWELHEVIRQTDNFGAPIDVASATPDALAPIKTKAEVYAEIERLYDAGYTDLGNAGTAFSFAFTSGFTSNGTFNTPATFRQLNRALKARALSEQGDGALTDTNGKYAAVLAILPNTFLNATPTTVAQLNTGAYHIYSTIAGDQTNPLYEPAGRAHTAHPSLRTDVQYKNPPTNTQLDDRYTRKVTYNPNDANGVPLVRSLQGVSTNLRFLVYNAPDASVPIIRNEELLLLRAEARLHTGDRPGALADINIIRTVSGGLPTLGADPGPGGTLSGDLLLDELLYNKRYSLVYENGIRWVDMRKYGLLGTLPRQQSSHVTFAARPFPEGECSFRNPRPAGCATVQGLTNGPVVSGLPLP